MHCQTALSRAQNTSRRATRHHLDQGNPDPRNHPRAFRTRSAGSALGGVG